MASVECLKETFFEVKLRSEFYKYFIAFVCVRVEVVDPGTREKQSEGG